MNSRVLGPDGKSVENIGPAELKEGLDNGTILLIDVREPKETDLERIPGSVLAPLTTFDPAALPDSGGRRVVFSCRSGNRSVKSSLIAQEAGLPYDAHLAGGILAWKAAGYDTEGGSK
jgi:rhodanese-related sulfurtransferase